MNSMTHWNRSLYSIRFESEEVRTGHFIIACYIFITPKSHTFGTVATCCTCQMSINVQKNLVLIAFRKQNNFMKYFLLSNLRLILLGRLYFDSYSLRLTSGRFRYWFVHIVQWNFQRIPSEWRFQFAFHRSKEPLYRDCCSIFKTRVSSNNNKLQ